MKTLDETIFEAPYTMTPWEENALYYLKEYRDYMKNEIIKLQEEVKKQKEMIEFLEKPLTWDELRQMEGRPVWVEYGISFNQKRWVVIHSFHNTGVFCYMNVSGNYPNTFWQKDMGEDEFWQAYRKER